MLELSPLEDETGPDDLCLAFAGRDAVVSMRQPPDSFWRRADLEQSLGRPLEQVPLGRWQGQPCYGVAVDESSVDPMAHIRGNLYSLLGRVPDATFAAYGRALQLLAWRRDHQFCGRCGSATSLSDRGQAMACGHCEFSCYPRLAPCVIVAVTRGSELLLAAPRHRRAMFYSTLAGFIEPGESAEQAVAREIEEEVGIKVSNIRYHGSQPWPFPGQLMLGFYADYAGGDLRPDREEIEDAGWFSADNLPPIPPEWSIAGQLIRGFLEAPTP